MSSSHYLLNVVNICLLCLCVTVVHSQGILYHRDSETRQSITLDGLWSFALSDLKNPFRAFTEKWYGKRLEDVAELEVQFMAVPSSYNDIGTEAALRDHVGLAWYQREFYVPKSWEAQNVWIRFASVCYAAEVWINGKPAVSHAIGHLPFQAQVTSLLNYGTVNNITVSVDNTLLEATIPQGSLVELESGRTKQTYTFDFFNYAGIDRSVVLYTTPKTAYIDDISITTDIEGTTGKVNYQVAVGDGSSEVTSRVSLVDDTGAKVVTSSGLNGTLSVDNAKLWWPYLMDPNPGYLYTLKVELLDNNQALVDIYNLQIGIRTMAWNSTSVTINGKPIYLRGFGKHEDSDIRGKGLDLPLILRDFNLIKWIGANSFRTSHYPYAEEIMDIADRLGIMVIDESPAVNTENFSAELLRNHKQSITELIKRDKNRPSVIMWSAANEPRTQAPESEDYYRQVIEHIKTLDLTRPTTIVNYQPADIDHSAQFADVLSFNLYQGWYVNTGDLDMIAPSIIIEGDKWHKTHNKPVMIAEYGADTQEGLHFLPSFIWSEDYQKHLLSAHFSAFDQLRKKGWFIGELIWTYADFNTDQIYYRVGGNKKGIFTRNRQPKAAALLMRDRYWQLGKVLEGASVPVDLEDYVISTDNADDSNDSIDDDTSKGS